MVVLGSTPSSSSSSSLTPSTSNNYLSPYLQPLPSDLDPKASPLAMLTQACNQIESKLLNDNNNSKKFMAELRRKSLSPASSKSSSSPPLSSPPSSHDELKGSSPPPPPISQPVSSSNSTSSSIPFSVYSGGLMTPSISHPHCTDPNCRDPSCPLFVIRNAQLLRSSYLAAAAAAAAAAYPPFSLFPPGPPSNGPPFTCNWMAGSDFCGRRFGSSEELMSHLRSHTSTESSLGVSSELAALSAAHALYTPASSSSLAALQAHASKYHNNSPKASKSTDASQRFSPYSRPLTSTASGSSSNSSNSLPLYPPMMGFSPFFHTSPYAAAAAAAMAAAAAGYPPVSFP